MTHLSFPKISGKVVNLRELSTDDAITIVNLMNYEIAKYLYEVPYPYKIDDALKYVKPFFTNIYIKKSLYKLKNNIKK